jgi:hypothetical protein
MQSTNSTARDSIVANTRRLVRLIVGIVLAGLVLAVVLTATRLKPISVGHPSASVPATLLAQNTEIATINDIAVPARELQIYLDRGRAATITHFQTEYHAATGAGFWTTRYGDSTPSEYLIDAALADIARATIQIQWAVKYGIAESATYDAFLAQLRDENLRRHNAIVEKKPIYGPAQYTEGNYFQYLQDQYSFDLQDAMRTNGTINIDTGSITSFLRAHPDMAASVRLHAGQAEAEANEMIVRLYTEDRYSALLAQAADAASVTPSAALESVARGCLESGRCITP